MVLPFHAHHPGFPPPTHCKASGLAANPHLRPYTTIHPARAGIPTGTPHHSPEEGPASPT